MRKTWSEWAPVPLRLMLGTGFIIHGYPKLFEAEQRQGFQGMLEGIGVPMPEIMAWVVGAVEFFGGLMLILGLLTWLAALLLMINMFVAMFTVHLEHGFNFINIVGTENGTPVFGMPGYEVNLLYIAGLFALLLGGAGAMSVDSARRREPDTAPVDRKQEPVTTPPPAD